MSPMIRTNAQGTPAAIKTLQKANAAYQKVGERVF
jgi:hypothetical protein